MNDFYINRNLEKEMIEAKKYFPVMTITGPRQSGKTTIIKKVFNELPYLSLEDLDVRAFAINDPRGFLLQNSQGMILDEVQNAPQLLSYIQTIVDENPSYRYVLSGSAQFSVLRQITQSLAGRTAVFELLPLSISELTNSNKLYDLNKTLFSGFYPAIYVERNIPKYLYPSYIKTYIERDVRDILNIKDLHTFQIFLKLCAGRIGSILNISELANEIGVAVNTIKSWISILEASYIITLLPPYFENSRKRLIKSPKLYFYDTGLACALLDINEEETLNHDKMRGHLFENMVIIDFIKQRFNSGKTNDLSFYRDSNGNEIDLLIPNKNKFIALEIKSSSTYHTDFQKGFNSVSDALASKLENKAIVYAGDLENLSSDIKLINWQNISKLM
ncbi:MAG: ATP-binding protein [Paludibacteraceae bacterium]|nr:ATP-binding protein [Paludibacteraceae bacterium]